MEGVESVKWQTAVETDVGIRKDRNEDSVMVKHAMSPLGEVLFAVICDGMGGLAKGELASASVIRAFEQWFHHEMPSDLAAGGIDAVGMAWSQLLIYMNGRISAYGRSIGANLGTTFSGILLTEEQYVIAHVGDSRIYHLSDDIVQLTEDQTLVAQEVRQGILTQEQARTDRRRNILLQCVGSSREVVPQVISGKTKQGVYLLCSDGFRNKLTDHEIWEGLHPDRVKDQKQMHHIARSLIETAKARKETDNITAAVLRL